MQSNKKMNNVNWLNKLKISLKKEKKGMEVMAGKQVLLKQKVMITKMKLRKILLSKITAKAGGAF